MSSQNSTPNMSVAARITNSTGMQSDMPPSPVFGGAEVVMAPTNLYALKVNYMLQNDVMCMLQPLIQPLPPWRN